MFSAAKKKLINLILSGIIALGCIGVAATTALISSTSNATPAYAAGWQKDKGGWCYNTGGNCATDWKKINGCWYYFNNEGCMQTGWQKCGGCWYYLNKNGAMQTDWNKVGNCWYYLNSSGVMQTGWQKVRGRWYYLNQSGAMQTGWYKVGPYWYYSNDSGAMQSDCWIGNYYVGSDGAMKTNCWIGNYYVGNDGAWIPNYGQSASGSTGSNTQNGQQVCWTPRGNCYHAGNWCPTLQRSRNIIYGTIAEAGNRRPCLDCC